MKTLFTTDYKNYEPDWPSSSRPSARAIILTENPPLSPSNKIALAYAKNLGYYKFPGGGIKSNETNEDALIREVKEEVGLEVVKDSIKEYGLVTRKEAGKIEDIFIQENYYYFCEIADTVDNQNLDDYEKEEGFTLRWIEPSVGIETNLKSDHNNCSDNNLHIIEREAKVLKLLMDENI